MNSNPQSPWPVDFTPDTRRIIVISDLHLGIDDRFAETTQNRDAIIAFLNKLSPAEIDELVIAGDLLDEWFVPISFPPHTDLKAFFNQVATNNTLVIEAFKQVIQRGIQLTYVPGNHDLLLDEKILAELIPGIQQSRDVAGLGRYRTGRRQEIVIEHGHRYDTFCTPDTLSNKHITGDYPSILNPGYFFTRMAATSVSEGKSAVPKNLPEIAAPAQKDADQLGAYAYYRLWSWAITHFPISADFSDKVIFCGVDGYNDSFSLDDLLPALQADGGIRAKLFEDVQKRWEALQEANGVIFKNTYATAVAGALDHSFCDQQAVTQYFDADPTVDVVVFGHTHVPVLTRFSDGYNREKVYANSGTWIDTNLLGPDRCFVAIESGETSTAVRLMQYLPDGSIGEVIPD